MESWLIEMGSSGMDTIDEKSHWNKGYIHKIPASLVDVTAEQHYKPRTVSFGPYHCNDENLLATEHKDRAVLHFVKRSKRSIREYYEELEKIVSDLQFAYTSLPPYWQENKDLFLQLMIRDGCFMLEFLTLTCVNFDRKVADEYAPTDPIFSRHQMIHSFRLIKRDMLLLENQLPLLVLRRLLAVHYRNKNMGEDGIDAQIRRLLGETILKQYGITKDIIYRRSDYHVLDVYRRNQLYDVEAPAEGTVAPPKSMGRYVPPLKETCWSVRQLHEAGIRIKKNSSKGAMGNISFDAGTLGLPQIIVDVRTEDKFLNSMPFERLQPGLGDEFTSFIFFMSLIINDASDISFLRSHRIIVKDRMGTDEDIAQLFQWLSKDIRPTNKDRYRLVFRELQNYWYKRRWRGYIIGTYFRNPWAPISVIASFIIFILTFASTWYTIYAYYKNK